MWKWELFKLKKKAKNKLKVILNFIYVNKKLIKILKLKKWQKKLK